MTWPKKLPVIPTSCGNCPIRLSTVCRPLAAGSQLDVVQKFKTGDRVLAAGMDLFRPGEECKEFYNLLDGWVALYQISHNGRRQILDFLLPGAFVGYQPELLDAMSYGAACLTDVSVCVFPRRDFPQLLESYPAIGVRLAWLNSHSTINAYENLTNVGCRPAEARIAHLLLSLYVRINRPEQAARQNDVEIPLTQSHIADALGLTNVYVSQILKQLRERNLLIFRNGRLKILDPDGLANIADFDQLLVVGG